MTAVQESPNFPKTRLQVTDPYRTDYAFDFYVMTTDQVAVALDAGILPAWTVTLDSDGCGTVSFAAPLPAGAVLTIYRDMAVARVSRFNAGAPMEAAALNAELDNMVMLLEQTAMRTSRLLEKPLSDGDISMQLPPARDRAQKLLGFDSLGQPQVYAEPKTVLKQIMDGAAEAAARALSAEQLYGRFHQAVSQILKLQRWTVDLFTGDGTAQTLSLSAAPGDSAAVFLTVDGQEWYADRWKLDENRVMGIFPDGALVQVRYGVPVAVEWRDGEFPAGTPPLPLQPTGTVTGYAGGTAPAGWLMCDGAEVSRTAYAALFAVIGETYGAGDGETSFCLPDLRGRVPLGAGAGSGGLTPRSLGATGGAETHTLTIAEMPSHTHQGGPLKQVSQDGGANMRNWNINSSQEGRTSASGGSSAHNNMQPYLSINFIIKKLIR